MSDNISGEAIQQVLRCVDALRPELASLTSRLVQIPSLSPSYPRETSSWTGDGEQKTNEHLAAACEAAGLAVDLWVEKPGRANLVATLRGTGSGPSLIFNGHVDTVPPGDPGLWRWNDPFSGRIEDGLLYGRGSCDMKGPVVAAFTAMRAIKDAGLALKGNLLLQSVCGEELMEHEVGTTAAIRRGHRADAAVVVEPSRLEIQPFSPDLHRFRLDVPGKNCHAAVRHRFVHPSPDSEPVGVNAIEKAMYFITMFQRLEQEWAQTKRHRFFAPGQFTIHPATIALTPAAMAAPSIVPDHCIVDFGIRVPPGSDLAQSRAEIEEYVQNVAQLDGWLRQHPPTLSWTFNWPGAIMDPAHPLIGLLDGAYQTVRSRSTEKSAFPAGSDATFLIDAGIPSVVFGPGDLGVAHAIDEHISVDELVAAAKIDALVALRWCGLA